MLKSIATGGSECTAKHKNKASYNTDFIVPDLIDFSGDDWKEIKTQTLHWLKIGFLLVISQNFLSTICKNDVLAICIFY